VALVPALLCVRGLAGSQARNEALGRVIDEVRAGKPLADALAATRAFDRTLVELVRLGEESGDIAGMLGRAAERAERSVNVTLRTLTKVVEPVMILAMGVVVGGLVAAMLLPIVEMNAAGGG
jgi:type II secretory pathway component PulF